MDEEMYLGIKKGKSKTWEKLKSENLQRSWFLSYETTQKVETAAPLFLKAWELAVKKIRESEKNGPEDFSSLLSGEILALSQEPLVPDGEYRNAAPPQLARPYQHLVQEIRQLSPQWRTIYLLNTYGGLSRNRIAEITGKSWEEVDMLLQSAQKELADHRDISRSKEDRLRDAQLTTQLRNPQGTVYQAIQVPDFLVASLDHNTGNWQKRREAPAGKGLKPMQEKAASAPKGSPKLAEKRRKTLIKAAVGSVAGIAVIALGIAFVPRLWGIGASAATVTTYEVEAITYGNVDTTISGSGNLTPVSQQTMAVEQPVTVTAVNYAAGDAVEEGAVIVTVEDAQGSSIDYTAPYGCVLLELPVSSGDELESGGEVAMLMGTDGFTMGIAVDEQDISTVAVGQEVAFTVDAVDGEYTGEVTNVSYNGSSNGSATAYQITARVDYAEGIYPGMSATAEIVVEESGEGLLVPVEAVQTSGDEEYITLAPSSAAEGDEYGEDEIEVSELSTVTVETGMSDGSYILVESDELAEGDLIVVTRLTSTQTGSDSQGSGGMGGGFPGGGMDFGDFDFENFDPGTMPQGGNFPGMGS